MSEVIDKNRKFYDEYVAGMIHEKFGSYESRIAVGIVIGQFVNVKITASNTWALYGELTEK